MTNSKETSNKKVLVAETKGEKEMTLVANVKEQKARKLNVAYQQDIIEIFQYIYLDFPQKHTYYSLALESSKSLRSVHRVIEDLNSLCPCINITINEITNCAYLSVNDKFTEEEFDRNFGDPNNAPLLYVFLKSFFIRKMSLQEIMDKVVVLTKRQTCKNPVKLQKAKKLAACYILRSILYAAHLVLVNRENNDCYIGNVNFLSFE